MTVDIDLVAAVASVELGIVAALLLVYFTFALLRRRDGEPRRANALRAVLVALEADGSTAPPELLALGRRSRIRVILRAAVLASGRAQDHLREIATSCGLISSADRAARSRWWWKRLDAARLCAAVGAPQRSIRPLLHDRSVAVRAQAVEWALYDPSPGTIEALLGLLNDPAALCRFTVRDTLIRMGSAIVRPLAVHLGERRGAGALAGLTVAAALADAALIHPLVRLAQDPDPRCRSGAVAGLGRIGGAEALVAVDRALADPAADVRRAATHAAAALGRWEAAPAIARLLRDATFDVRREAALALRSFGSVGLLYLRRAVDDPDRYAADMARQLLDLPAQGG